MTMNKSELTARPGIPPTAEEMVLANQANWDARTPIHVASEFYGLDGSRTAEDWFAPFEWTDLGELTGRDVLHLQCHLGTETAAFAERGAARTVGLDFSRRRSRRHGGSPRRPAGPWSSSRRMCTEPRRRSGRSASM